MHECGSVIADIYNHPAILNLISKIKPESIRDDLRQEIAISLLEQPCDKIVKLFSDDNLLRYSMRVCWLMATSKESGFYRKYRKNDISKAISYIQANLPLPAIPDHLAHKAADYLKTKNKTIHEDHEVRIFNKYVELGSCRAVARYYGIPANHTCSIIKKIKKELKCILLQ